jgi:hypothetical protein
VKRRKREKKSEIEIEQRKEKKRKQNKWKRKETFDQSHFRPLEQFTNSGEVKQNQDFLNLYYI